MKDLNKLSALELAAQLDYWQKHKPRIHNRNKLFEYCWELSRRVVSTVTLPPWTPNEIEDFIIFIAEEMYLLVLNRDNVGNHYYYFRKGIKGYIEDWCKLESKQSLTYNDKANIYHNPAAALRHTPFDMETILDKDYTSELVEKLWKDVQQCIRYSTVYKNGVDRVNARISMSLSIKYGKFVSFRLGSEEAAVTRYLYNKFKVAFQKLLSETHQCVLSDAQYLAYIACEIRGDFDNDEET